MPPQLASPGARLHSCGEDAFPAVNSVDLALRKTSGLTRAHKWVTVIPPGAVQGGKTEAKRQRHFLPAMFPSRDPRL